ncbi:unnamed protein product [Brassicogethes aeneus]|uniref:Uncharacterized protein n=1 Tax=Brassicogethes aeneus TaxID=1431903 RepID=A0A9P0FLA4_BRAAE|nr:unnamed protein product [Brassicogethes aeneus]
MKFLIFLVVLVCFDENVKGEISTTLPELLRRCYESGYNNVANPPLSIPVLIELIRKIEMDSKNTFNLRLLSSALLHGVQLDGIRKQNAIKDYIQYAATGPQFYKYKLVTQYLTSMTEFYNDTLSTDELCFLHKMISNSIDPTEVDPTCSFQATMPLEFHESSDTTINCQYKMGTVKSNWGPISPGQLIIGIASAMEQSDVSFQQLRKVFLFKMKTLGSTSDKISLWSSTIAGDLAMVILSQMSLNLEIGDEGFWNDTALPRRYYLNSVANLTEGDILGGIDATIIALNIQKWVKQINSLRLSQVIDMYYSTRGVTFDNTIHSGNRASTINFLRQSVNLENQVLETAKLLIQMGFQPNGSPNEDDLVKLAQAAVETFTKKSDDILRKYDNIEPITNNEVKSAVELIVILDNSYDSYTSQRFLSMLSESLQISYYGSQMGIINGETGSWISNVTTEIYGLFQGIGENLYKWPSRLDLNKSLKTAIRFYQNKTNANCTAGAKPMAKSIIILSKDGRITDVDKSEAQFSIKAIKDAYPECNLIYVTPDENGFFRELSTIYKNDSVVDLSSDISALVNELFNKLNNVPASIVNFYCNQISVRFEDFITPAVESFYEIHEEYIKRRQFVTKFTNYDLGSLHICYTGSSPVKTCRSLKLDEEVVYSSSDICPEDTSCNIHFFLYANSSTNKCTGNECRYPDQVRVGISMYSGAAWKGAIMLLVIISTIINII